MLTYTNKKLQIYFGDASDGIYKQLHCSPTSEKLITIEPFKAICTKLDSPRLSLLNQVHGIHGLQIQDEDFSFNIDGDYLITHRKNVGIGVLTADCVPLILYDEKNHAIAAIHAGWKGAVEGVALKAFEHMKSVWNSDPHDMQLFIGPSAKSCCYQVQEDLVKKIDPVFVDKVIVHKHRNLYFDTAQLVALQLNKVGIAPASINKDFNFCTICDERFYSHRRQGQNSGRQISLVFIK